MTTPAYLIQGDNIIVVIRGDSYTVGPDHAYYAQIKTAIKDSDWETVERLAIPTKVVVDYGAGHVEIKDGAVYWQGEVVSSRLAEHMLRLHSDGFPVDPLLNFMTRLMKNPSKHSIDQCYDFITRNKMPITPDGFILAFKKVRKDTYMDIHSGTLRNKVGDTVSMERSDVSSDPYSYCSAGLHFCSEEYLDGFGSTDDHVMIVSVDPADVVSVPADANGSKARCCKYTVVAEVSGDCSKALASAVVTSSDDNFSKNTAKAAWPFLSGGDMSDTLATNGKTVTTQVYQTQPVTVSAATYRLVRKYDPSVVVATGLTKTAAEDYISRMVKQKKAVLIMQIE